VEAVLVKFSTNLIKLISSFLSQRKFRFSAEDEISTLREIKAGVPQVSVPHNLYINDTSQTTGVNLALFADDTSLYATERKEGYVLRKLQRALNSSEAWCKHGNIKINE
jgi:hypothetical protein